MNARVINVGLPQHPALDRDGAEHPPERWSCAPVKRFMRHWLKAYFSDVVSVLLVLCGIAAIIVGFHAEGAAIIVALFLANVFTAAYNTAEEGQQARAAKALQSLERVQVFGQPTSFYLPPASISASNQVVLRGGDRIYFTGQLVDEPGAEDDVELKVDESAVISHPRRVVFLGNGDNKTPTLVSGGYVLDGCRKQVVSCGWPRDRQWVVNDPPKGPSLAERMVGLIMRIANAGACAGSGFVLAVLLLLYLDGGSQEDTVQLRAQIIVGHFIVAVTLLLVSVPEGLETCIKIGKTRMTADLQARGCIVKNPSACYNAGRMDVLFIDKTGTLTVGDFEVPSTLLGGPYGCSISTMTTSVHWHRVLVLNASEHESHRDAVDTAIHKFVTSRVPDALQIERNMSLFRPRTAGKMASVVSVLDSQTGITWSYMRGAWEHVLYQCYGFANPGNGLDTQFGVRCTDESVAEEQPFGFLHGQDLLTSALMSAHCRGIGFAMTNDKQNGAWYWMGCVPMQENTGVGPTCRTNIQALKQAGIKVVMITADERCYSEHIAYQARILRCTPKASSTYNSAKSSDLLQELAEMDSAHCLSRLQDIDVVYRCCNNEKKAIVMAFQKAGLCVGVTGQGTSDAQAIAVADIGVCLHSDQCAQIALDAADIVVPKDGLSSIVQVVGHSRVCLESVWRFITFQLAGNFSAVALVAVCAVWLSESPLRAVQLVWINVILDVVGPWVLSFPVTEDELEHVMDDTSFIVNRKYPYGPTTQVVATIVGQAAFMFGMMLWMVADGNNTFDVPFSDPQHYTCVFNVFVFMLIGTLVSCAWQDSSREVLKCVKLKRLLREYVSVLVLICTIVVQALLVELGGSAIQTAPLSASQWIFCLFMCPLAIVFRVIVGVVCEIVVWSLPHREVRYNKVSSSQADE